jgi:hypothetical protein
MTIIGYARVSTDGQSLQCQTEALHQAGAGRVYSEKIGGAYSAVPNSQRQSRRLVMATRWLCASSIGSRAALAISSTLSTRLGGQAQHSSHLQMVGPTPQRRMVD